ncbi:MAG: ATPase domain-containing protein [Thermoplasmata archaeon]
MYNLINEIFDKVLTSSQGYSLLLKGPPGSGKTTLALSILDQFSKNNKPLYFSTRVGDSSLYQQFPWLKKYEKNVRILISTEQFLSQIYKETEEKEYKAIAKKFLNELNKKPEVSRLYMKMFFSDLDVPEIEHIYREIESKLPDKSLIVIDSLEGLSSRYGIGEALFTYMVQKDLVESANATVIFVSEKNVPSPEDYVVDGILYLTYTVEDGKRFRELNIKKLRGASIENSSISFTLNSGRFYAFNPLELRGKRVSRFNPIPERDGTYSTGIEDLDRLLGGGIRYGSFFNIQVEKDVTLESWRIFETPIVINFFLNDYRVFAIPTPGYSYETNKKYFSQWVPEEILDKNTTYIDYSIAESKRSNVIALAGKDPIDASEIHRKTIKDHLAKYEKTLFIIHHDFLEYSMGPSITLKNIFANLNNLKPSKSITVSITKPGQEIAKEITNLSDYQINLLNRDGITFIYGIKPRTVYHAVEIDEKKGFPYLRLVPLN